MPEGREGKMEAGLLMSFLNCSQKHLGHSFSKESDEGLNLYGMNIQEEMKFIIVLGDNL